MQLSIFDLLVTVCGLYMAYSAVMMKTKGRVNSGVVMSRNLDESQLKDKEGFIKYIWPKLFAVGLLCAASGIFNIVFSYLASDSENFVIIEVVVNGLFFILLIAYAIVVSQAQKKYFR